MSTDEHNIGTGNLIVCQVVEVIPGHGAIFTGLNGRSMLSPGRFYYLSFGIGECRNLATVQANTVFAIRGTIKSCDHVTDSPTRIGERYTLRYYFIKCSKSEIIREHSYPPHRFVSTIPLALPCSSYSGTSGWLVSNEAIGRLVVLNLDDVVMAIRGISITRINDEYFIPDSNTPRMFELISYVVSVSPNFNISYIRKHVIS